MMIEVIDLRHAASIVADTEGPEDLHINPDGLMWFVNDQATKPKTWANSGAPGPDVEPLSFARGIAIGVAAASHAYDREQGS